MNTTTGKIAAYDVMRKVISNNTKIVSFFKRSHYWGGQLALVAKKMGVNRVLKTHTETRWYSMILQAMSVREYQCVNFCPRLPCQILILSI